METSTIFNKAQIEVLNALAVLKTDDEVRALKQAISEFFAKRADEAMERLWDSGAWNDAKLQSLATAHYRTPYK